MKAVALFSLAAAAFLLTSATAASKKPALHISHPTDPVFPLELARRGILHGEVDAVISITPEGRVADWLVTAYTEPEFEKMAAEFLPTLECTLPSSAKRTGPVRVSLSLLFETRGVVVNHTINDTIDRLISGITQGGRTEKMALPRELDRALTASRTVAPLVPATPGPATNARVVLEFLIDENGRVRMPVLQAGENPLLANAAVDALLEWQFTPPTRAGRPVIVSARQEFVISARE